MIASMSTKARATFFFFITISALGLFTAMFFNIRATLLAENYITDGFTSNVDLVYSLDLLIGGTAGMAFMIIEGRRLGMRYLWAIVLVGFVTAFAFAFPLFLALRVRKLDKDHRANGRFDQYEFNGHRVDVWVPSSLNPETPVLVMHDGKNLFFPEFSTFGGTWGLLDALRNRKIGGARIVSKNQPLIVGVWQQRDALRLGTLAPEDFVAAYPNVIDDLDDDFKAMQMPEGFTPYGNEYQALIAEKILPVLADLYAIKLDRARTAMAGSSMGGLASLYGVIKHPEVYGAALSFSTHWPIGGNEMVDWYVNHLPKPGTHKIWSDTGTIELDAAYPPFHKRFAQKLEDKGYTYHEDFVHAMYPNTGHNELWWAGRVEHPINWWLNSL